VHSFCSQRLVCKVASKIKEENTLTVYFDGSCPLCRREIAWYQKQRGGQAIAWQDVSGTNQLSVADDLTKDAAMRRFHVRKLDGKLVSGAVAFSELWRNLPMFRLLGFFVGLPVIRNFAEVLYRLFLRVRPSVQQRCE